MRQKVTMWYKVPQIHSLLFLYKNYGTLQSQISEHMHFKKNINRYKGKMKTTKVDYYN